MAYTITSDRFDCPKAEGDVITEKELLEMGVNIEALIEGGHISPDATSAPKAVSTPSPIIAKADADAITQEGAK